MEIRRNYRTFSGRIRVKCVSRYREDYTLCSTPGLSSWRPGERHKHGELLNSKNISSEQLVRVKRSKTRRGTLLYLKFASEEMINMHNHIISYHTTSEKNHRLNEKLVTPLASLKFTTKEQSDLCFYL